MLASAVGPIGPKARHLNRDLDYPEGRFNELAYWTRIGYLKGAPDPAQAPRQPVWDNPASGSIEARARAYLEVNCAHCHSPQGSASNTGLYLSDLESDQVRIGFCKTPVATGKASADMLFDSVRGHPEVSILIHRMASDEPKIMMPEIGRTIGKALGEFKKATDDFKTTIEREVHVEEIKQLSSTQAPVIDTVSRTEPAAEPAAAPEPKHDPAEPMTAEQMAALSAGTPQHE